MPFQLKLELAISMTVNSVAPSFALSPFSNRPSGSRAVDHYAQTMHGPTREALGDLSALAPLLVRGILLWIIIPIGFALWLLAVSSTVRPGLGEFLGWLDLNLIAALHRAMVRPLNQIKSRVRASGPNPDRHPPYPRRRPNLTLEHRGARGSPMTDPSGDRPQIAFRLCEFRGR